MMTLDKKRCLKVKSNLETGKRQLLIIWVTVINITCGTRFCECSIKVVILTYLNFNFFYRLHSIIEDLCEPMTTSTRTKLCNSASPT